jgi:hypothetical protein
MDSANGEPALEMFKSRVAKKEFSYLGERLTVRALYSAGVLLGKRVAIGPNNDQWLVVHLMIAGYDAAPGTGGKAQHGPGTRHGRVA